MRESVLHFVWKNRLFKPLLLKTFDGKPIEILHPGYQNHDSGPDFQNARIRIDGQLWAGNIEIHVHASQWRLHGHHLDQAYKNVVLHVVHTVDIPPTDPNEPPILELKGYLEPEIVNKAENLLSSADEIACSNQIKNVDTETKRAMISRAAIERLEHKYQEKAKVLEAIDYDYHKWLLVEVFNAFGLKANTQPMQSLAMRVPLYKVVQLADERLSIEALLYGLASLLPDKQVDDYTEKLIREFYYLKAKFQIDDCLPAHMWKFHRIQPVSFPTIRLSQVAALLMRWDELVHTVFKKPNLEHLKKLLSVEASSYWNRHYRFGVPSEREFPKKVGNDLIHRILINAIIPLMIGFGKNMDNLDYQNIALEWLEHLPSENNRVIRSMTTYGFPNKSALESQGLLQLRNFYCVKKKCLFCSIGYKIIKS
ncbi:hypothetical protein JCM31826_17480 [Thermaurantimonas aggregans]|uniref:DUF2851 domain-containing protein n=1 Tax=Thermaurantimonas aggregans TaxID=2173829 RepID=A0A401XMQ7_9FLAO|nr:DUF2851 family protein [Thermaurantimonas aggregans]MCX8147721.1 DUF2851 family protein [Thermaurantimonas aggregans]GCD78266.1 hypothetical protein JCM31826_17480 [Thermaurantimonas aggregans]